MDEKLRKLRSEGTLLKPKFIIGKNGITDQVVANIKAEFKRSRLIKIRILGTYLEDKDKKAVVDELLEKTGSRLVQFIGFTVVLGRR